MRRVLVLATLLILWLPSVASAGLARIGEISTDNRYNPSRPVLIYTAAPGERNRIVVARVRAGGDVLVLRDTGAGVLAGPGCAASDKHTVSCRIHDVTIDTADGDDIVTVPSDPNAANITEVRGGEGADMLSGTGTLSGGPGRDVLTGSPYPDSLLGGTGDDVLRGGGGGDRLDGDGDGVGELRAPPDPGGGDDVIDGGAGSDRVLYVGRRAGVRVDLAAGRGSGGGGERDRLARIENITGGRGADVLLGDTGRNLLEGRFGDDRLAGRGGSDALVGGEGTDTLRGGAGNDRLDARGRRDRLIGGAGNDRLISGNSGPTTPRLACGSGYDTIEGAPDGQLLDGCEQIALIIGVSVSVRPTRRPGGALRFDLGCDTRAANPARCSMTMTLRRGSGPLARRSTAVLSPARRHPLDLRPARSVRRGESIEVAIRSGVGTLDRIFDRSAARWRVKL